MFCRPAPHFRTAVQDPTAWLTRPVSQWSALESRAAGQKFSQWSISDSSMPQQPMGMYVVAAASLALYFALLRAFVRDSPCSPECVCCFRHSDRGEGIGCCQEPFIADAPNSTVCRACRHDERTTTPTSTDDTAVNCMRQSSQPCFMGVHLAALALAVLAATTPTRAVTTQLKLINTTASVFTPSSFDADFTLTLGPRQACLFTTSASLVSVGYTVSDCCDLTDPRPLFLLSAQNQTPPNDNGYTVRAVKQSAAGVRAFTLYAEAIAASMTCVVLVLLCYMLCNMREGKAARCFKVWGCASAAVLVAAVGVSTASAVLLGTVHMSGEVDDFSQMLLVNGPLVLAAPGPSQSGTGQDALSLSLPLFFMTMASSVVLLPLIGVVCCGIRNGGLVGLPADSLDSILFEFAQEVTGRSHHDEGDTGALLDAEPPGTSPGSLHVLTLGGRPASDSMRLSAPVYGAAGGTASAQTLAIAFGLPTGTRPGQAQGGPSGAAVRPPPGPAGVAAPRAPASSPWLSVPAVSRGVRSQHEAARSGHRGTTPSSQLIAASLSATEVRAAASQQPAGAARPTRGPVVAGDAGDGVRPERGLAEPRTTADGTLAPSGREQQSSSLADNAWMGQL